MKLIAAGDRVAAVIGDTQTFSVIGQDVAGALISVDGGTPFIFTGALVADVRTVSTALDVREPADVILDGDTVTLRHTPPPLNRAALIAQIDADADAIYSAVLGARGEEYTTAADQAQAFKDAGYTGTVPDSVQSWMDAKGWTEQEATDDILATAAAWQNARKNIRAARLLRKEQIRTAADDAAAGVAVSAWRTFRDGMRAQLKLPPV